MYLAKLKAEAEVPHVEQESPGPDPATPLHETITEFREKHADDAVLQARLVNKVKVCAKCGKACAYTLDLCNACGESLEGVKLSYTDNVFMGFIYGIGRGKFPYTISIRKQTKEFLCFDDPLALSVCHLNAIPTTTHIADLRYLFTNPQRGLEIINAMFEVAATAALESFWSNAEFRRKFFANEPAPSSPAELFACTLCGMNFPPSIYQLHLQFIQPPMLPYHYALAREENHFHHGRFFPLEYLRRALALGDSVRMEIRDDTSIQDIISRVNSLGVNYDEAQVGLLRRCRRLQERFSPWQEDDFAYQVINGQVFCTETMQPVLDKDPQSLQAEDTKTLQNYGRPYSADRKPTGSYYGYAKKPSEVTSFAP